MTAPVNSVRALRFIAAAGSVTAGALHGVAAVAHGRHGPAVAGALATVGVAQVMAGLALLARPVRPAYLLVTAVDAGAVGAWTASRTVGLPLPGHDGPEALGALDTASALAAALAVAAACLGGLARRRVLPASRALALVAAVTIVTIGGVAGAAVALTGGAAGAHHEHRVTDDADAHQHDAAGNDDAAPASHHDGEAPVSHHGADGDDHTAGPGAGGDASPRAAWSPSTEHLDAAQLAAAEALRRATEEAARAYADIADARAAGYVGSATGANVTRVQHWASARCNRDGVVLDPACPEALIYLFDPDAGTYALIGVMYQGRSEELPEWVHDLTGVHTHDTTGDGAAPYHLHVWFFDGVVDAFGRDYPSALGEASNERGHH
jgi:hypothetical protein